MAIWAAKLCVGNKGSIVNIAEVSDQLLQGLHVGL